MNHILPARLARYAYTDDRMNKNNKIKQELIPRTGTKTYQNKTLNFTSKLHEKRA